MVELFTYPLVGFGAVIGQSVQELRGGRSEAAQIRATDGKGRGREEKTHTCISQYHVHQVGSTYQASVVPGPHGVEEKLFVDPVPPRVGPSEPQGDQVRHKIVVVGHRGPWLRRDGNRRVHHVLNTSAHWASYGSGCFVEAVLDLHCVRTRVEVAIEVGADVVPRAAIPDRFQERFDLCGVGLADRGQEVIEEATIILESAQLALHGQPTAAIVVFVLDTLGVVRYARDTR